MRIYMKKLGTGFQYPPEGLPIIDGTRSEDSTLLANVSGVSDKNGITTPSLQWYKDNVPFSTDNSITLTQSDVGSVFRVEYSYVDGLGKNYTLLSVDTMPIMNVNDAPTGQPTIVGNVQEENTVTVDISSISDEDGLGDFSYQWIRNGSDVVDADTDSYTIPTGATGELLSVRVTWTDAQGTTEYVISETAEISPNAGLYEWSTSHTFQEPFQSSYRHVAYSSSRTAYTTNVTKFGSYYDLEYAGVHRITIPRAGTYRINCAGGAGGFRSDRPDNGRGRIITAEIYLDGTEDVFIVAGKQGGAYSSNSQCGGGGGGSVVSVGTSYLTSTLLVAAGGGGGHSGGSGGTRANADGQTGTSGGGWGGGTSGLGATQGDGSELGNGGSGWLGPPTAGDTRCRPPNAIRSVNPMGSDGVYTLLKNTGGWGGAAAGWGGAGGGGGFSGGGAQSTNSNTGTRTSGGGGGSYLISTNSTLLANVNLNAGDGYVTMYLL